MPAKAADAVDLHVRLPRDLHERAVTLGKARGLPLNTVIVLALWDAVESKPPTAPPRPPLPVE